MKIDALIDTARSLTPSPESVDALYDQLLQSRGIPRPPASVATKQGTLISVDGHSGSGKDTQIDLLGRWLRRGSRSPFARRSLSTVVLKRCDPFRDVAKSIWARGHSYDATASFLLLCAGRRFVMESVVAPLLAHRDQLVIQNRSYLSHVAYHAGPAGTVNQLLTLCGNDPRPDLALVLSCDAHLASARVEARASRLGRNLFVNETPEFIERVKLHFLELAAVVPGIEHLDSSADIATVAREIRRHVDRLLMDE